MSVVRKDIKFGDLDAISLYNPISDQEVSVLLFGANVMNYKLNVTNGDFEELLFVSKDTVLNGTKGIRGGIPIVFPKFGDGFGKFEKMKSHGFARIMNWTFVKENESDDFCELIFELKENKDTLEMYPYKFHLLYHVILLNDGNLVTRLEVINKESDKPLPCQALLHTYYALKEVEEISIEGFDGCKYQDKVLKDEEPIRETKGIYAIDKEVDYIHFYKDLDHHDTDIILNLDKTKSNKVKLTKKSNLIKTDSRDIVKDLVTNVVLWNPWIEKSKGYTDLDDEEYHNMLCIEPGNVGEYVQISPNESLILEQQISKM